MIGSWKRGDLSDRLGTAHLSAESVYERQEGNVTYVIERVLERGHETNAYARPSYRLISDEGGEWHRVAILDTLREARALGNKFAALTTPEPDRVEAT